MILCLISVSYNLITGNNFNNPKRIFSTWKLFKPYVFPKLLVALLASLPLWMSVILLRQWLSDFCECMTDWQTTWLQPCKERLVIKSRYIIHVIAFRYRRTPPQYFNATTGGTTLAGHIMFLPYFVLIPNRLPWNVCATEHRFFVRADGQLVALLAILIPWVMVAQRIVVGLKLDVGSLKHHWKW